MIHVVRCRSDNTYEAWDGSRWVSDPRKAKPYEINSDASRFGEPFPTVEAGDRLGFVSAHILAELSDFNECSVLESECVGREHIAFNCYWAEMKERACKHVALVLSVGGNVRSVVLVKRNVMESHPEVLERLQRQAQGLYDCELVTRGAQDLKPSELANWFRDCIRRQS